MTNLERIIIAGKAYFYYRISDFYWNRWKRHVQLGEKTDNELIHKFHVNAAYFCIKRNRKWGERVDRIVAIVKAMN